MNFSTLFGGIDCNFIDSPEVSNYEEIPTEREIPENNCVRKIVNKLDQ